LAGVIGSWQGLLGMTASNPYRGFRYPAAVIEHAVWLYHCFSLSLRDVELILAARGIVRSYESIREWGLPAWCTDQAHWRSYPDAFRDQARGI
jgi:transposase-like protein